MNVVMIGPFGLQPKGTLSVRALPMAKALAARGHSVTLLIPPWDHPQDSGREWEEDSVHVVNVRLPARLPLLFHGLLTFRLVRRALSLNPQVIHCFKPKAYAGLAHLTMWWLRRLRRAGRTLSPAVRLVVDADDWEQAWNVVETYSPAQKRVFAWQERWGLTHADALVVASRALTTLVAEIGVAPGRVFYVPNGIRPALLRRLGNQLLASEATEPSEVSQIVRMLWELEDAPVVLLYTRFFEFKLERIVNILGHVVHRVSGVKLLIVGEGLFGEESELDDLLAAGGLSEHAVFTGWVQSEQLANYFSAAEVAIFPYDDTSINRAKCSVKLIDLLVAGLPVVADAVGQNTEYIVDGESGLLVPPGDDVAFANSVVRLLQDAQLRARLGMAAARRMRERFTWEKLAADVERAYQ